MTNSIPPTSQAPMANYSMPPRGGNGYAVGSLICSLAGFCVLFVGGIAGIILGVMGLRRAKETGAGGGLATAGLIVGIISLLTSGVLALFGGAYIGVKSVIKATEVPRAVAKEYMTDLSTGNLPAASALAEISQDEIASQSAAIRPLGAFRDMTSNALNVVGGSCVLTGKAQFANGTQSYTVTLTRSGSNWKVSSVQLQ